MVRASPATQCRPESSHSEIGESRGASPWRVGTGPFPSSLVPFEFLRWSLFAEFPMLIYVLPASEGGTYTQRNTQMSDIETTYRLIALSDRNNAGQTALTPDLAKLVPGDLVRTNQRLGIERTDWTDHFGKPKIVRTVLIDAEATPEEWTIGVDMPPVSKSTLFRKRSADD